MKVENINIIISLVKVSYFLIISLNFLMIISFVYECKQN
jgi:hypothetical protein